MPTYSLSRTSTGLLFRDEFDRADGALTGWTVDTGITAQITGQVAEAFKVSTPNVAFKALYPTGLANIVGGMVVESEMRGDIHSNCIFARFRPDSNARKGLGLMPLQLSPTGDNAVGLRWGPNSDGLSSTSPLGLFSGFPSRAWGVFKVEAKNAANRGWIDGVQAFTPANVAGTAVSYDSISGVPAMAIYETRAGVVYRWRWIRCYSSNFVTISNLPSGFTMRVGSLVSSTGTLDLEGTTCPAAAIEVLDEEDVVVETFSPADGVWGGDVYYLNTAPEAPVVTVEVSTTVFGAATVAVSAVVDPDVGDDHEVRLQVAVVGSENDPIYDSGWVAAPLADVDLTDLPLETALVAWAQYRDDYDDGEVSEDVFFIMPRYFSCSVPNAGIWTSCPTSSVDSWDACSAASSGIWAAVSSISTFSWTALSPLSALTYISE